MAAYLTFGLTNALIGHANGWTESSNMSVRWWNQRNGDYGAGFLMMLYVVDTMGGSNAFQRLIADSAKGGQGIVNLALAPEPGATPVGTTFSDIFANFSAAATLDSNQLGLGFSNLDRHSVARARYVEYSTAVSTIHGRKWPEVAFRKSRDGAFVHTDTQEALVHS